MVEAPPFGGGGGGAVRGETHFIFLAIGLDQAPNWAAELLNVVSGDLSGE